MCYHPPEAVCIPIARAENTDSSARQAQEKNPCAAARGSSDQALPPTNVPNVSKLQGGLAAGETVHDMPIEF
jgi:hypothetical protein